MIIIRITDSDYKKWKKNNDSRKLRKRIRRRRNNINKKRKKSKVSEPLGKKFIVPSIFSIINNPEETIYFLNNMINEVEKLRKITKKGLKHYHYIWDFFIDMSATDEITSDALMYLLTIIKNTRENKILPVNWIGNFPKSSEVKEFLKKSGYLKYMKTASENLIHTNDYVQIKCGKGYTYIYDGIVWDIRKEIIDFSCEKLGKEKIQINFLMTMLTELITNINDHAYDNNNMFEPSWYIFVEDSHEKLSYTFMDNGLGIPTTIRKYFIEKIIASFNCDKEYKYIEAAVDGVQKRSKTGKIERGNGLPSIYEQSSNKNVNNLVIISNRAFFCGNSSFDMDYSLIGTIFYWEIKKEEK